MYPKHNFRYAIETDAQNAIVAISREPLDELLCYWKQTGKPANKLHIYQQGIQHAISNDRYPLHLLDHIRYFPEFFCSVKYGLLSGWCKFNYNFVINSSSDNSSCAAILSIGDNTLENNLNISSSDKIKLIPFLLCTDVITLLIGNLYYPTKVCLSKTAKNLLNKYNLIISWIGN